MSIFNGLITQQGVYLTDASFMPKARVFLNLPPIMRGCLGESPFKTNSKIYQTNFYS
jgi:hypothetical protein